MERGHLNGYGCVQARVTLPGAAEPSDALYSRMERKDTLLEAFEQFNMEMDAAETEGSMSVPPATPGLQSSSPFLNDDAFDEDALLVLLSEDDMPDETFQQATSSILPEMAPVPPPPCILPCVLPSQHQLAPMSPPALPAMPTSLPLAIPNASPSMAIPTPPAPPLRALPDVVSAPRPAGVPHQLFNYTHTGTAAQSSNKYTQAIGAALRGFLDDDDCVMPGAIPGRTTDAAQVISKRVAGLETKLKRALEHCLESMAYPHDRAAAMAAGDVSSCTEIEMRPLSKVQGHMHHMVSMYSQVFNSSMSAASHGFHNTLALSLTTDIQLVERFEQQLVNAALQLWALMHILEPHPSREVKEGLAALTNKTVKQVNDWFTNWRARHWKKIISNIQ